MHSLLQRSGRAIFQHCFPGELWPAKAEEQARWIERARLALLAALDPKDAGLVEDIAAALAAESGIAVTNTAADDAQAKRFVRAAIAVIGAMRRPLDT